MGKNKILAIIVTYKPEIRLLKDNVESLTPFVDGILIWENSPEVKIHDWFNNNKIEYGTVGENIGISKALNIAWKQARKKGYTHIISMDQDSLLQNISVYIASSLSSRYNNAVFGPIITTNKEERPSALIENLTERGYIITSGTIVPISVLEAIDGYNETFLVDAVDIDFCIRLKLAGFSLFRNHLGVLLQNFGSPCERVFLGKTFIDSNYSPFRLYGIFRNHVILYRQYKKKWIRSVLIMYFRHFVPRIILWEDNKMRKLLAIINGLVDGIKYKL